MKVLIVTDQRVCHMNGKNYTEKAFLNNVERYKKKFGEVAVFAKEGSNVYESSAVLEDTEVFLGGTNWDAYSGKNKDAFREILPNFDLAILRVPSALAITAAKVCRELGIPYLVVVIGCIWDSLWNHSGIGKILAACMFIRTRKVIWHAEYATYVSQHFLQKRYPFRGNLLAASDVSILEMNENVLQNRLSRILKRDNNTIILFTAGGLNVKLKGQQYVIKSIPMLNAMGIRVEYYLAGTGKSTYLKEIAKKYKVEDQVHILGSISQEKVLELMDKCDIYIQPSLTEGLPRAVVEAMSRACPCIGTGAGGMSELIDPDCCFRKKSPKAIAKKILQIWETPFLETMANKNFEKAKEYQYHILQKKRDEYFDCIIKDVHDRKEVKT